VTPRRRGTRPRGIRKVAIVVTCEHGGNRVPIEYQDLFRRAGPALASHRGWDAGTVALARDLAREVAWAMPNVPMTVPRIATVTRLLADLNRSPHNPRVFSEWTRTLSRPERLQLLERYHTPHRMAVDADVAALAERGRQVLHLALHSFAPFMNGHVRQADLALLYDPARKSERALTGTWARTLQERLPELRVRRNQPYRGASDGLTTWLRRRHRDARYMGIEVEVNQTLLDSGGRFPREVTHALAETLAEVVRGG
jgi:predicted N-formylglutamate amidohydrolase